MRVVLDTNILVSALIASAGNPGAAARFQELRESAIADDTGQKLAGALADLATR